MVLSNTRFINYLKKAHVETSQEPRNRNNYNTLIAENRIFENF